MDSSPSSSWPNDAAPAGGSWTELYDGFIAHLRRLGVGKDAPQVGSTFPDFALPNDRGRYRTLMELTAEGPLVLSFNRGGWCPFCIAELSGWGEAAPTLREAGGRFVSIAAEVGGRAEKLHGLVGDQAEILVDVDHGLALAVGLAFRCDDLLRRRYLAHGLNLGDVYGSESWFLPVPATFVIDRDRTVRYAFVEPDFRLRAQPSEVISVAATLR